MTQDELDIDLLYSYVDSGDTDVAEALARILAEVERQNERWERGLGKYDKMIKLAADYRDQYKIADAKRVEYKERIAFLEAELKSTEECSVTVWQANADAADEIAELEATLAAKEKMQTTVEEECAELQAENKRLRRYEVLYVARHGGTDIDGNKWVYEDTEVGKQVKAALQEQSE